MYDTPVLISSGTTVYTYAGYAQVTAVVTFVWIDYSVAPAMANFKASMDMRLAYYQPTLTTTGFSGSSLTGKSFSTNGQLVNKKAKYLFQTTSDSTIQSVTFQLSDDL